MANQAIIDRWERKARANFVGHKIVHARYMTDEEMEQFGWYSRPVILHLDNGTMIFPSMDDEGNDGGALFTGPEELGMPVIRN